MTVYCDDMMREASINGSRVGKWSHLLADTTGELAGFATALGLNIRWLQHPGTYREHYDVTATIRAKALRLGATPISYPYGTAEIIARKRAAKPEQLWFASWRCNCTILQRRRDEIPDRCPDHAAALLAPPELTGFEYGAALGIQPDHREATLL